MARAFTLVELLVVITILIVLLALLAPALDRAVYQAELAVCAARQHAIIASVTSYTAAYKRAYPVNQIRRQGGFQPAEIGVEILAEQDLRPVIKDYIPFVAMLDPLAGSVDLWEEANEPATEVFSTYELWMGWRFTGPLAGKGMIRFGDKVEWRDNLTPAPPGHTSPFTVRSNILVGDANGVQISHFSRASHPDVDGRLRLHLAQNGPNAPDDLRGNDIVVPAGAVSQTRADWVMGVSSNPRGTVDLNYGYDDGSVSRFTGVTGRWNDVESDRGHRFYAAPWVADSNNSQNGAKWWLPARP